ncbi:PGAP1 family protein [Paenibacillus curdlanolyticus YK9]|uniref:PGAP1 family protein n=1 Tax=Paenibacillus curdlanolyticus YK9 TaxID=717606 RepID=E0IAF9_9BACL|nr:alpha/beta fold hydrolase [Paenibacillus curdlanolyticus]EFM10736.1 PGAP1 family protein [Paenibacillus curdlanolyticus YK9]
MEKQLTLKHEGLHLTGTLHYPTGGTNSGKHPAIIICHGFVGSRIGVDRLFVKTARALAANGAYVLRFDYGGCGESDGDYGELGLESMIAQTRTAIDYVTSMDTVDLQRVVLLGHSLGGATALLTSVRDRRVKRLVLWSPVAYPFNDIVRIVGRSGYDEAIQAGSTDYTGFTLKPVFFESLQEHQPFQEAPRFGGDVLLVHGTSDDVIPADYSFLYQKVFWTRGDGICDKEIIFQADHTYSTRKHQEEAIGVTTSWLAGLDRRHEEWHHWSI